MKIISAMFVISFFLATPAWSADGPSLERGKELFNSTQLGSNGKSCATCHRGGNKLEEVNNYSDEQLAETVSQCIRAALKGKAVEPDSSDVKSLVLYVRKLGKPGKGPDK